MAYEDHMTIRAFPRVGGDAVDASVRSAEVMPDGYLRIEMLTGHERGHRVILILPPEILRDIAAEATAAYIDRLENRLVEHAKAIASLREKLDD